MSLMTKYLKWMILFSLLFVSLTTIGFAEEVKKTALDPAVEKVLKESTESL